jgi:predicted metal-dependent hydrolase
MQNYSIRRSSRAKKIRLIVRSDGVELILPKFIPEIIGKAFASQHKNWIEKQVKKSKNKLPEILTEDGSVVFFMGKSNLRLQIKKTIRKSYYEKKSENLIIFLKENLNNPEEKKIITDLIKKFYKDEARKYLIQRSEFFAKKLKVKFGKITIREQKTRWGSCTSKGNINYNWKIMKEDKNIIDYLVIHEICHRKEMNHSSAFWKLVEQLDSNYKRHRTLLNNKL